MSHYYYALSGQSRGPITAGQLKELAEAGQIQPETMIYKEGQPQWVPAAHFPGLLAAAPPSRFAAPVLLPDQSPRQAPTGSARRLGLVVGGVLGLAAALAIIVFVLLKQAAPASQTPSAPPVAKKAALPETDEDLPPPETVTPPKKETPSEKKPEPLPEFTKEEILARYQKDPQRTLQELEGKRVILKYKAIWKVEALEKLIDKDNTIHLVVYPGSNTIQWTPHNTIYLTFPNVNPNSKLGFFAKIKEYVEKLKLNDRVELRVAATLRVSVRRGQKYLSFEDAEVL